MSTFNENKGRFMSITHANMRERKIELDKKRTERMDKVYDSASTLVDEYKKSLKLESDTWEDLKGVRFPYVTTGIQQEGGSFIKRDISSIPVFGYNCINFAISTVIDDSPRGGDSVIANIRLFINDQNEINVVVNSNSVDVHKVINGSWDKVCSKIKDDTFIGITELNTIY